MYEKYDEHFNALVRGMLAGARVVSTAQVQAWVEGGVGGVEQKFDNTYVSAVDKEAEAAIMCAMGTPPGLRIRGEEGSRAGEGDVEAIFDPLDGTSEFLLGGPNSTTGGGLLDSEGRLIGACTVLPTMRLAMLTRVNDDGTPARTELHHVVVGSDGDYTGTRRIRQVRVCADSLSVDLKSVVWIDHTHGFVSEEKPVLDDRETRLFAQQLSRYLTIRRNGTNLGHQFMVAGGRPNAVASVTLAKGGTQDLIGAWHVLGSGGVIRGYNVLSEPRALIVVEDPRKIRDYTVLIAAATQQALDLIEMQLRWCVENDRTEL